MAWDTLPAALRAAWAPMWDALYPHTLDVLQASTFTELHVGRCYRIDTARGPFVAHSYVMLPQSAAEKITLEIVNTWGPRTAFSFGLPYDLEWPLLVELLPFVHPLLRGGAFDVDWALVCAPRPLRRYLDDPTDDERAALAAYAMWQNEPVGFCGAPAEMALPSLFPLLPARPDPKHVTLPILEDALAAPRAWRRLIVPYLTAPHGAPCFSTPDDLPFENMAEPYAYLQLHGHDVWVGSARNHGTPWEFIARVAFVVVPRDQHRTFRAIRLPVVCTPDILSDVEPTLFEKRTPFPRHMLVYQPEHVLAARRDDARAPWVIGDKALHLPVQPWGSSLCALYALAHLAHWTRGVALPAPSPGSGVDPMWNAAFRTWVNTLYLAWSTHPLPHYCDFFTVRHPPIWRVIDRAPGTLSRILLAHVDPMPRYTPAVVRGSALRPPIEPHDVHLVAAQIESLILERGLPLNPDAILRCVAHEWRGHPWVQRRLGTKRPTPDAPSEHAVGQRAGE